MIELNQEIKDHIVHEINYLRDDVAAGRALGFPPASRMRLIVRKLSFFFFLIFIF